MMHLLVGHQEITGRFKIAIRSARLPQVLLLTGPHGVGKQRLGLWLAQRLLCLSPTGDGDPCGTCRACHRVLGLEHPDLHWFVPIPRPKASDPDKQVDEAEETLAEVMATRRADPRYGALDGMASHGIAAARLLARRVRLTPAEGARKVFLLGNAERLVPQESSPEAANSLLKILEEPPADTVLILTAPAPGQVLPTIRSRAVPVRVPPLADALVRRFLEEHLDPLPPVAELTRRVARAEGSIGAAWAGESDAGAREAAARFLEAALAGGEAPFQRSLAQPPWQARGECSAMLEALSETMAAQARRRVQSAHPAGPHPAAWLDAMRSVDEARTRAQGNVNPQLLLATLAAEMGTVLA